MHSLQQIITQQFPEDQPIGMESLEQLFGQMYTILSDAMQHMDQLPPKWRPVLDESPPHTTADVIESVNACSHHMKMWLSMVSGDVFKHMISIMNAEFSVTMNAMWEKAPIEGMPSHQYPLISFSAWLINIHVQSIDSFLCTGSSYS